MKDIGFYFLNPIRIRLALNTVVRRGNMYGFLFSILFLIIFSFSASCIYVFIIYCIFNWMVYGSFDSDTEYSRRSFSLLSSGGISFVILLMLSIRLDFLSNEDDYDKVGRYLRRENSLEKS